MLLSGLRGKSENRGKTIGLDHEYQDAKNALKKTNRLGRGGAAFSESGAGSTNGKTDGVFEANQ